MPRLRGDQHQSQRAYEGVHRLPVDQRAKATMDRVYDSFWGSRGMQTAQYWSSNQYSNESRYQYRDATANGAVSFYAGPLQDLQTIIDLNRRQRW